MKVFFSHASEDKALVEQVFSRVAIKFPEITGWLDKYEILGGDDLIETIHAGISDSDKFLIFLSSNSIDKPWVRAELRKALADEINGVKPEFIIPIKVGHISQFPPFLESRFYIDIESKTEEQWLSDIYAAITRKKPPPSGNSNNLQISIQRAKDNPNAAVVVFAPQFWAEPIGFKVTTTKELVNSWWIYPEFKGMQQVFISEIKSKFEYGVMISNHTIKPKMPFAIALIFDDPLMPINHIKEIQPWNGDGGEKMMRVINFT